MKISNYTALLPLKGHSERVPGKNLKICAGKPLFHWILETLIKIPAVREIIINTDSPEIVNSSRSFRKVVIHDRPENLKGDFVSMNDIINYDINNSEGDYFLQTHATNPLLSKNTIESSIVNYQKAILNHSHDSLLTVTEMYSRFYDHNFVPINHNPAKLLRTQDLNPIYEENSNLYVFSRDSFIQSKTRIGQKPLLFPMNKHEALDIDNPEDFEVAEAVLSKK